MEELRQQLQSMKKQTATALEQSRKSSDREQATLLRAQESFELEKIATAKATRAAEHENYMLGLMSRSSHDMAGTIDFSLFIKNQLFLFCFSLFLLFLKVPFWILLPKTRG
jgi:hypothetical protein